MHRLLFKRKCVQMQALLLSEVLQIRGGQIWAVSPYPDTMGQIRVHIDMGECNEAGSLST